MGEGCGIVLIYALYFKEPVMNIGRILENFFGSMSFFKYFMCFTVIPIYLFFLQNIPNIQSII